MQMLKKRNMYMSQLQTLQGTQFNVEQMKFATESVQDTLNTVSAMKEAAKIQKQQMKQVKIGEIDSMMDDIADLQLDAEEVNDIMSRDYSSNVVDEDELEAELAELDNEGLLDELDSGSISVPSGMPVQPRQEEGKIGMPF
jgi:charged multivesicular body protein 5